MICAFLKVSKSQKQIFKSLYLWKNLSRICIKHRAAGHWAAENGSNERWAPDLRTAERQSAERFWAAEYEAAEHCTKDILN